MMLLPTTLPAPTPDLGHTRLCPALPERLAVQVLRALRSAPHTPTQHVDASRGHQLWRYGWEPGTDCSDLGHALLRDLPRLIGRPLRLGPLVSDHHKKGAFIDPFDARTESFPLAPLPPELGPAAYLVELHLVTQPWPATWGGRLSRLDPDAAPLTTAPDWNTLDLFDLTHGATFSRPLLEHHVGVTAGFTLMTTLHAI
ncbi:MAG TPA: hypothetical protein PK095_25325 [Myxococcota bacterium]|nr:hypothetical protein [Myxococcota bacterium]